MNVRKTALALFVCLCVSVSLPLNSTAQIRPVYDQGALGLAQLLARLNTNARALMIGAHPDDEDTALLAYLARGEHALTGYLSLTRGDGGQNIIGPELGEALGVIRTEELLQARKLDGATQFFTRAYDYGFSKTLAEAKQKWDEKLILCDVVRVIRKFKPQVVIAGFTGTPSDGHGQHQFAGFITPIAVKAAADPGQCTQHGAAWPVSKLYVRHRGQDEATLRINTGKFDPLLGRSYFEVAMHARSQHRSQEQGVLELRGEQFSSLKLLFDNTGSAKGQGLFSGIDVGIGWKVPEYSLSEPQTLIPALVEEYSKRLGSATSDVALSALLQAAGIRIDVLADRETAVRGDSVPVSVRIFSNTSDVDVGDVTFNLPFVKAGEPTQPSTGTVRRETAMFSQQYRVSIPSDADPTEPYWLKSGRTGDIFSLDPGAAFNEPFQTPGPVFANIDLMIGGTKIPFSQPVEFRYADDIRGEIRRELNIVPRIAVAPDKNLLIVSTRAPRPARDVSVTLTNNASGPTSGKLRLVLPPGWTSTPQEFDFSMTRKGESTSIRFTLNMPRSVTAGAFHIRVEAFAGGETFSESMQTIAYEHIQTHRMYRPARAEVKVIDVQVAPVKVGYIRGSGDRVPEAIAQLGLNVEEIDERMLATGDLSSFDTIVVGIRAYQVRSDIAANNKRLMEFANNGGTLIVQYQLPPTYSQLNMAPFPMQMGPRVADENAPVTMLDPAHPLLSYPNKISAADFEGWVQERNLYNFSTMDPKYVGLLESHDAGEAENKGGLVVANLGKGKYVYCSYSLFRQLPAGVPGAYRLLANLVSLPKAGR